MAKERGRVRFESGIESSRRVEIVPLGTASEKKSVTQTNPCICQVVVFAERVQKRADHRLKRPVVWRASDKAQMRPTDAVFGVGETRIQPRSPFELHQSGRKVSLGVSTPSAFETFPRVGDDMFLLIPGASESHNRDAHKNPQEPSCHEESFLVRRHIRYNRPMKNPLSSSWTHLDNLRIISSARPRAERFGEHRSRAVGGDAEFADYRPYVLGDDLRLVDWNLAARTERLFLKQRIRETGLPVHLLLDGSRSMNVGDPSPWETGKELALGFAYIALRHGDSVRVASFGDVVGRTTSVSGFGSLSKVENALERAERFVATDFERALRGYVARFRGEAVAVVLSDLLDPRGWEEGVRLLWAHGFEVFLVHLVAPELEQPPLSDNVRLKDSESDELREVLWNEDALEAYISQVNDFFRRVEGWCRARGVLYARIGTKTPLRDAFHKTFRAARMIGT